MELRQLECFIAVAEELHFGRAAIRLHLSQPPLSRTIQQLETELGTRLLERTRRKVELSAAGAVFLDRARRILALAADAREETQRVTDGRSGTLTLSFVGSAMYTILPRVLRQMRRRFPDITIRLHEMTSDQQVAALLDGSTQAAIIRPAIIHPQLESRVLLHEKMMVALPADHPLAGQETVSVRELSRDTFILFPRRTRRNLGNRILDLCAEAGFAPAAVQEALEMQTGLGLVAGGLGVSIVPEGARRLAWPGLVLRPMPEPAPTIDLALVFPRQHSSPILPHLQVVIDDVLTRRLPRRLRPENPSSSRGGAPE